MKKGDIAVVIDNSVGDDKRIKHFFPIGYIVEIEPAKYLSSNFYVSGWDKNCDMMLTQWVHPSCLEKL